MWKGKKKMARKNQDDIWCFEADTVRERLIDDLQIDSTRVPLYPKKKKPQTSYPVWRSSGLAATENSSVKLAVNSKGKGL